MQISDCKKVQITFFTKLNLVKMTPEIKTVAEDTMSICLLDESPTASSPKNFLPNVN